MRSKHRWEGCFCSFLGAAGRKKLGRFRKAEGGEGMLRDFTAGSSVSSSLGVGLLQSEADGWPQRREGSRERLEPLL